MNRRSCLNHPDWFCYVCGKFTPTSQKKNLTKSVKVAYKHCFGCKLGDQDKAWAPHISCKNCYTGLTQWLNGKRKNMPFSVPIIWRKPANYANDCYFCLTKVSGCSKHTKSRIVYPACPSELCPVTHLHENITIFTPLVSKRDNDSSLAESTDFF